MASIFLVRCVCALVVVLVGVLALGVGSASAEALCTDTWTGPGEGEWATAADWSTGKAPTSTDVVCIGEGTRVSVTEGAAGVLLDKGTLVLSSGSLEVANALEASSVGSLIMGGGSLTGAATVDVVSSFVWEREGSMSGSGSTVLLSGATGSFTLGNNATVAGRTFVNEGTLTLGSGELRETEGAVIKNVGMFKARSSFGIQRLTGGAAPSFINTGTFEKTEGAGITPVKVGFENRKTVDVQSGGLEFGEGGFSTSASEWIAAEGAVIGFANGSYSLEGTWSGTMNVNGASVTTKGIHIVAPTVDIAFGSLSVPTGYITATTLTIGDGTLDLGDTSKASTAVSFTMGFGLTGAATLYVSGSFVWERESYMSGTGSTVLLPGVKGTMEGNMTLSEHTLINEGTLTLGLRGGEFREMEGASVYNTGTFNANKGIYLPSLSKAEPSFFNSGVFEKTEGTGTATIDIDFFNAGRVMGDFEFLHKFSISSETQYGGGENPSAPWQLHARCGDPVSCATGNFAETQTDFAIGGRGVGLDLKRTYNSQAGAEGAKGPFGYGWTSSFSDHLVFEKSNKKTTLVQATGGTVPFTEGSGESFTPPAWTQDTLTGSESSGYTLTLANQTKYKFAGSSGRLESVTDREGNATTLAYGEAGRLTAITDPAGRKIKLTYNSEGLVEAAEDPMGHIVKYAYEGGSLKSVTQPAESGLRWQFKYDGSHEITEMIDGRGGKTVNEYSSSHQVTKQEDPAGRKLKFEYASFRTKITNENTGSITDEYFTDNDEPSFITRGYGTSNATSESFTYNEGGYVTSATDGNEHVTKYGYNSANDRTSMVGPDKNETKWEYNSTHDVISVTTPKGETTTIKRDSHGNPEVVERPAPESKTQSTKYKYTSSGELESMEDPLKRVWQYEYDTKGDRTAETDPLGNKRTWEYNEDSQETSMVSPRGNVTGGEPAAFTTTIERDAQGRPVSVAEPPREPAYSFAFGSSGSGNGQFQFPTLEAVTSSGNIWVSDSSLDRVQEFNEKGEYVAQFGVKGTGAKEFKFPFGIAINPTSGNMYVSDYENYRVQEFSSNGTFIRMFGYGVSNGKSEFEICTEKCQAGLKGSGSNGQFGNPDGVAIDSSGNLWVADETNNRLEEYTENGAFVKQFGTKGTEAGQIKQPVGLAYDHGNLYVAEAGNQRVQEFTTAGVYVTKFGSEGTGNGQFKVPYAIAAGPTTNDLYVTDRENNRVEIFTASGRFLSSFGSKGKGNAQMELPTGVVATAGEAIYISDHNNKRVDSWTGLTSRVTKYTYDGNGNLETRTDPNGNKTTYTYDADNEPIKVEEPNKAVIETEYDGAGQVIAQIDGNKHTTKYARNAVEEVTEVTDPLGRVTKKEYDAAGNLKKVEDSAKRTTTYAYDPANRLTEIVYSSGKPATVTYEYDKDGDRTKMTDGTGTTKYAYDQLDRLTETENGHKEVVKYEYDLANQQTAITYPNGKTVTRAYDKAGRLEKVTDWLANVTKFAYDSDSDLTSTTFPSGTSNEDVYAYNLADQMSEVKMLKGTETLASLVYARDANGQVSRTIGKGLPGSEITEASYDPNSRLTKYGSTEYKYDAANNPTKVGASENTFNEGNELEKGTGATYSYDELGERVKTTPSSGPATTYGYDQAGNLIAVERPKEGITPEIKDTYAYDGDGLRAAQTVNGTTTHLAWDMSARIPLILGDGVNSYIYGPRGLPVEQINGGTGAVQYLHHDQAGSTRLITGSTGTVEGKCSYAAYGAPTCEGTATTPLGYDAQYTSADTGLVYLRMRSYDPATAQFMSVDPANALTRQPYTYAESNPLTFTDPRGLCGAGSVNEFLESLNPVSSQNCAYEGAQAAGAAEPIERAITYAPVVDVAAGAGCLVSDGAACVIFLDAALTVNGANVAIQGAATCWESPGRLAAEALLNALLSGGGRIVNWGAALSGLGPLGRAGLSAPLTGLQSTYDATQTQ